MRNASVSVDLWFICGLLRHLFLCKIFLWPSQYHFAWYCYLSLFWWITVRHIRLYRPLTGSKITSISSRTKHLKLIPQYSLNRKRHTLWSKNIHKSIFTLNRQKNNNIQSGLDKQYFYNSLWLEKFKSGFNHTLPPGFLWSNHGSARRKLVRSFQDLTKTC